MSEEHDDQSKERQPAELVSPEQVAQMLGCTKWHVHNLRRRGLIPQPVKLGKSTRYRKREIIDWIVAGCPDASTWTWKPTEPITLDQLISQKKTELSTLQKQINEARQQLEAMDKQAQGATS